MAPYRMANGVLVDIPAEAAERIDGLTPVDSAPSSKKAPAKKAPAKTAED